MVGKRREIAAKGDHPGKFAPDGSEAHREYMAMIGRKGSAKALVTNRRKQAVRATVSAMLSSPVPEGSAAARMMAKAGFRDRATALEAVIAAVLVKAIKGDLKAASMILDLAGATSDAAEKLARIEVLKMTAKNGGLSAADAVKASAPPVDPADLEAEAERLGVYGRNDGGPVAADAEVVP